MKKKILLFTLSLGLGYIALSSYTSGAASNGLNRTGAQNTTVTCGGVGCHGGTSSATTVTIVVDSAGGVPVSGYQPGGSYTIVITGHNTSSLPKFGYQVAVVSGSGASQVQAGTCTAPSGSHLATLGGLKIVEQSSALNGSAGTYTVSIPWTAPAASAGLVTIYCTVNAVDGTGGPSSADKSNNNSISLFQEAKTGVAELSQNIGINAYPNPANSQFNVKMENATGAYAINVYDMSGRIVYSNNINANGATSEATINCSTWAKGYYAVQISQNGAQRVLPVVKL